MDTAFYMVHSMGSTGSFEEQDRAAATGFGRAARDAGVRKIVYLGGLGDSGTGLSRHLQSRQETGACLRASGVPVIELRASIVLGSGSLSFEMIRALVERLPVMICPRWVKAQAQPIAIEDVVAYLVAAPRAAGREPHPRDRWTRTASRTPTSCGSTRGSAGSGGSSSPSRC